MNSKLRLLVVIFVSALMASTPPSSTAASVEEEKEAILALITRMETAWNRSDFHGYMEGFANPDVVFVSRGVIQKDWQGTLDHYIRDYGASEATRGVLHFSDISIEMLAPDAALLNSRFQLDRPQSPLKVSARGSCESTATSGSLRSTMFLRVRRRARISHRPSSRERAAYRL